jgi:Holliday junction resolvasome RuvABC ATP-dependent DNA helicase subunit
MTKYCTFTEYAKRKNFIGQAHAIAELELYVDEIKAGRYVNFLVQAYAGYGKTTLIRLFITYLIVIGVFSVKDVAVYLPDENGHIEFKPECTIQFIDEAHMLKNPEMYYNAMTSPDKYLFLIATNEYDDIKDPMITRSQEIIFTPYSLVDMMKIVQAHSRTYFPKIQQTWAKLFAGYSRGNPRVAQGITRKMCLAIIKGGFDAFTPVGVIAEYIKSSYKIHPGGFTPNDIKYLDVLKAQGTLSLNDLVTQTKIPKKAILNKIEPFLMGKQMITKSSRGRSLVEGVY